MSLAYGLRRRRFPGISQKTNFDIAPPPTPGMRGRPTASAPRRCRMLFTGTAAQVHGSRKVMSTVTTSTRGNFQNGSISRVSPRTGTYTAARCAYIPRPTRCMSRCSIHSRTRLTSWCATTRRPTSSTNIR